MLQIQFQNEGKQISCFFSFLFLFFFFGGGMRTRNCALSIDHNDPGIHPELPERGVSANMASNYEMTRSCHSLVSVGWLSLISASR